MTSIFTIYHQTIQQKLSQPTSTSEVNVIEIEKLLKQMAFQISLSSQPEQASLQKKYNECSFALKEFKTKKALGINDSKDNEEPLVVRKESEGSKEDAILAVNSAKKLMMIKQLTNEIEVNGKEIVIQLDSNKSQFKMIIEKVKGMNWILDDSRVLVMKMINIGYLNKRVIAAFAIILIIIFIIIYMMKS